MTVEEAIERYGKLAKQPFDWKELDQYIIELHRELTDPKWAIDDPVIRNQFERIVVNETFRLIENEKKQTN